MEPERTQAGEATSFQHRRNTRRGRPRPGEGTSMVPPEVTGGHRKGQKNTGGAFAHQKVLVAFPDDFDLRDLQ